MYQTGLSFINVDVIHVKRSQNVEAHRLVGIAKYEGCRTWLGHVPNLLNSSNLYPYSVAI
ncbi:hypothetical protein MTR_8g046305 [Medicago truncatula]|uniref:RNase H type-1 domain-containing protein n=1 Tax=Medicago truncatula TaxID=3880 RepID=A0A072U0I7_MEDTR|nr:hypothetical protein MTR_8g046305 [Medicago truncatula]